MTDTLTTWLARLRETAEAATPVPRTVDYCKATEDYPAYCHVEGWVESGEWVDLKLEDAQHIAACDPTTIRLMADVVAEAAMRQQAIQLLNDSATGAESMGFYCDRALEHDRAIDAALNALRAHVSGGG